MSIINLLNQIKNQEVVLPAIQRDFVWPQDKVLRLLDSIMRGYPCRHLHLRTARQREDAMRQGIKGLNNHPDFMQLREYAMDTPDGAWTGRQDDRAWGKSSNLFCYFTDTTTGQKFCLSVSSRTAYKPTGDGPAFEEGLMRDHQ